MATRSWVLITCAFKWEKIIAKFIRFFLSHLHWHWSVSFCVNTDVLFSILFTLQPFESQIIIWIDHFFGLDWYFINILILLKVKWFDFAKIRNSGSYLNFLIGNVRFGIGDFETARTIFLFLMFGLKIRFAWQTVFWNGSFVMASQGVLGRGLYLISKIRL